VSGAAFGYRHKPVLTGVDLTVHPGEFLGIFGPNGAGKTTLFRGLLGLLKPLAGTVERRRGLEIGYVPQLETLDPAWPLSVREVLLMGAHRRVGRRDREEASRHLDEVGLAGEERALFAALSGGQRQRVLIARALMGAPDLLCLDEPTSGVDQPHRTEIMELLTEITGRGPAVLMVAHELEGLEQHARGALLVQDGGVTQVAAGDVRGSALFKRAAARGSVH